VRGLVKERVCGWECGLVCELRALMDANAGLAAAVELGVALLRAVLFRAVLLRSVALRDEDIDIIDELVL
jgi:hypothetical protein